MAVAAADRAAKRADVDDHLVRVALPARAHHRVAARREDARRLGAGGAAGSTRRRRACRRRPSATRLPARNRRRPTRSQGAETAPRPPRTRPRPSAGARGGQRQQAAAVAVADRWRSLRRAAERRAGTRPSAARVRRPAPARRCRCARPAAGSGGRCRRCSGGNSVDCSKCTPSPCDLRLALGDERPDGRSRASARPSRNSGKSVDGVKESERLAGQVRVRRAAERAIASDVRGMQPDGGEHLAAPRRR